MVVLFFGDNVENIKIEDVYDNIYCLVENGNVHIGITIHDDEMGEVFIYEPRTIIVEGDFVRFHNPYLLGDSDFPLRISYNNVYVQFVPSEDIFNNYIKLIANSKIFETSDSSDFELIASTFQ